jgi:hypothetical protein
MHQTERGHDNVNRAELHRIGCNVIMVMKLQLTQKYKIGYWKI